MRYILWIARRNREIVVLFVHLCALRKRTSAPFFVTVPGAIVGNILGTFREFLNSIVQKAEQFSKTFSGKDRIGSGRPVDDRRRGGRYSGGGESDLFSFSREGVPNNFFSPFFFLYNAARQSDKKGIKSDSRGTKRQGSVTKMGPW